MHRRLAAVETETIGIIMGVRAESLVMDGLVYEKVDEDEIGANDDDDASDDKTLDDIIDAYSQTTQS